MAVHQKTASAFRTIVMGAAPAFAALLLMRCLSECKKASAQPPVNTTKQDIEIAPSRWMTVAREDREVQVDLNRLALATMPTGGDTGTTRLAMDWNGKPLVWQSTSVPFSLREWEGKLHLIALDRADLPKCRFRYYREEGEGFIEISPREFPKRIATQNMWLKPDAYSIGRGRRAYALQLARQLDPNDVYFLDTLTARVWCHLVTGKDYYETTGGVDKGMAVAFRQDNDPIVLPTIIPTDPNWPNTTQPTK